MVGKAGLPPLDFRLRQDASFHPTATLAILYRPLPFTPVVAGIEWPCDTVFLHLFSILIPAREPTVIEFANRSPTKRLPKGQVQK